MRDLDPCPLCGGAVTEHDIRETRNPGVTMSGAEQAIISVEITHMCPRDAGEMYRRVSVRGRDYASARAAWNRRPQ